MSALSRKMGSWRGAAQCGLDIGRRMENSRRGDEENDRNYLSDSRNSGNLLPRLYKVQRLQ